MAWSLSPPTSLPAASLKFQALERFPTRTHTTLFKPTGPEKHLLPCRAAAPQEASEESSSSGSTRSQLDLLQQLTSSTSSGSDYDSDDNLRRPTIREQLSDLIGDRKGEFSLPLGKKLKASMDSLTISQKRNIKRQAYMNEVERRNDSLFFATIGAFIILPPIAILSVAIFTGYVQLFP